MNLKKLNKIILLIILFVMLGVVSVNASIGTVSNLTFDSEFYADSYDDIKAVIGTDINNLKNHFANDGVKEGRVASPIFDVKYYLTINKDVADVFGATNYEAAYNHFLNYGRKEGRVSSAIFDPKYYLEINKDIADVFGATNYEAAYYHFLSDGMKEGRAASPIFDVRHYLNVNPDIANKYGANNFKGAYSHFMNYGMKEKEPRSTSPVFYVKDYLEINQDVAAKLGATNYEAAYNHYITDGRAENRATVKSAVGSNKPSQPELPVEPDEPDEPVTPPVEEHTHEYNYENPEYIWAEDFSTCTMTFTCTEGDNIIEITMEVSSEEITPADCKNDIAGEIKYTATAVYEDVEYITEKTDEIPAEHDFTIENEMVAPTCEKEGTYYLTCSVCGAMEKNEDGTRKEYSSDATGHVWQKDENGEDIVYSREATCTTTGYTAKYCTAEGKIVYISTEEALEHDYTVTFEWIDSEDPANVAPTAAATAVCANEDETGNIVFTDDTAPVVELTSSTAPVCETEKAGTYVYTATVTIGEEEYTDTKTYIVEATHTWGAPVESKDEEGHSMETKTCSVCGKEESENVSHTSNVETATFIRPIKAATCTETGIDEYVCEICKLPFEVDTDKVSHTLTRETAVAANCENGKNGNIEYWHCTTCDKYFDDENATSEITKADTIIVAKHTTVKTEEKSADCENGIAGNIEYYTCTECGKYFSDEEATDELVVTAEKDERVIPAMHTIVQVEAKDSTCTKYGNKEYYTCTVCGKYFEDANAETETTLADVTLTELVDHVLSKHEAVAATCTADGNIEYYTCANCDKYFRVDEYGDVEIEEVRYKEINEGDIVLSAKDATHILTHILAVQPTCTKAGNIEYWECDICENKFKAEVATQADIVADVTIPAKGHSLVIKEAKTYCDDVAKVYCKDCEVLGTAEEPVSATADMFDEDADTSDYLSTSHKEETVENVVEEGKTYNITTCTICGKETNRVEVTE